MALFGFAWITTYLGRDRDGGLSAANADALRRKPMLHIYLPR
jgi:hypothetical protein